MKCDELRAHLDDYLNNTLPGNLRSVFAQSLKNCPEVARETEKAMELRKAANQLRYEQQPERDLWPGIAQQLPPRSAPKRTRFALTPFYRIAAIITLAAATGLLTYFIADNLGTASGPTSTSENTSPTESVMEARAEERHITEEIRASYTRLKDSLLSQLAEQNQAIDPTTATIITNNLQKIREAIGDIEDAIRSAPNDPNLIVKRESMRRKEMYLIRHALDLATLSM